MDLDQLAADLRGGRVAALARAISLVENGRPGVQLDTHTTPVGTRYADVPMPTLTGKR